MRKKTKYFLCNELLILLVLFFFPGEKQIRGQDCGQGSWSKTSRSIQFSCGSAVPVKSPGTKFQL